MIRHASSISEKPNRTPDSRKDFLVARQLFDPANMISHEVIVLPLHSTLAQQNMPENDERMP